MEKPPIVGSEKVQATRATVPAKMLVAVMTGALGAVAAEASLDRALNPPPVKLPSTT